MEVPRLGVKSELQLPAYTTATAKLGSKLCLGPTPELTATQDPQPTEGGQGSNPHPYGYQSDLFPLRHNGNSQNYCFYKPQLALTVPDAT